MATGSQAMERATVFHLSRKILLWPRLFEGRVIALKSRIYGDSEQGDGTGNGDGEGPGGNSIGGGVSLPANGNKPQWTLTTGHGSGLDNGDGRSNPC